MGRKYHYNQVYRGRQGGSSFLKGLVTVLAIALLLVVAFLIYVSIRYMEYTDDGPKLNLPWLQDDAQPTQQPRVSDFIIIDGEPELSESATPEPIEQPLRALEVSPADVTGAAAQAMAAQAGAGALVIPVQDKEGNLAWQTALELAQEDMNGDAAFNAALSGLVQSGQLHLTARLSGFRDLWTSVYARDLAILYPSGKLWYDSGGISWISLSSEAARDYVTGLCLELAEMGFDEILLEHAGYPDSGRVGGIAAGDRYPASGREALVSAYLEQLSQKLEEAGAVLSVRVPDKQPDAGAASGVTPAALKAVGGRIWLPEGADTQAWTSALTQAGIADAASRLVAAEPLPEGSVWTGSRLLTG